MTGQNNYKTDLIQRYWDYQKSHFSDWQNFFERPNNYDERPPVFLKEEAWRNVILSPDKEEKYKLLKLIPKQGQHKWYRSMNSSQALAQSILGNLHIHDCLNCLTDMKDDDGNLLFEKAQITTHNFEMEHKILHLKEQRKTTLDGYISGNYQIAIECKFTEQEMGTCSRPQLTPKDSNYEHDYCNRSYTRQMGRRERCTLTELEILYWQYVPQLFKWRNDKDIDKCPLYKNYQLVRNILAIGIKNGCASLRDGHVLLIYDNRNPAFQKGGDGYRSFEETLKALLNPRMLRKCSWQCIVQHIRQKNLLPWLTEHLDMKYGFK